MAEHLRVMISSTARDLPEHRKEAMDACLRQGMFPIMMEHLPASDDEAVPASLKMVDEADIYLLILAYRYGYVPDGNNPSRISVTEQEYNRAVERKIPILTFAMHEDHPIKAADVEKGTGALKLVAFKQRALVSSVVSFFKSPQDLRADIVNALSSHRYAESARHDVRRGGDLETKGIPSEKKRELMRVFIASPSDVRDERSRMPKVIESLNKTLGRMTNILVELWRWEADATPAAGEPQALINPELDRADVVVVIFWNRFGMRTSDGKTGTETEVMRSLERWKTAGRPQVMMYFCQRPARLDREQLRQSAKVIEFRERIAPLALVVDYEAVAEFEWRVRDDLFLTLSGMLQE